MVNLLVAAFHMRPQASLVDTARQVKLYFELFCQFLLTAYCSSIIGDVLCLQLLVMFAGDADEVELMRALLADCTSVFLRLCSSTSLSTQSDLIQAFYNMHLKLFKKDMNMAVQAVGSNLSEIFKCGMSIKCFSLDSFFLFTLLHFITLTIFTPRNGVSEFARKRSF